VTTIVEGIDDGNSELGIITSDGCPGTVITVDGGDGIGEATDVGTDDGKAVKLIIPTPG